MAQAVWYIENTFVLDTILRKALGTTENGQTFLWRLTLYSQHCTIHTLNVNRRRRTLQCLRDVEEYNTHLIYL